MLAIPRYLIVLVILLFVSEVFTLAHPDNHEHRNKGTVIDMTDRASAPMAPSMIRQQAKPRPADRVSQCSREANIHGLISSDVVYWEFKSPLPPLPLAFSVLGERRCPEKEVVCQKDIFELAHS